MRTKPITALLLLLSISIAHASAQKKLEYGVRAGFNSTLLLVSDFSIDGLPIEEVQNNYKIGWFGSLFMRINFDRHFLQPELSYSVSKGSILFGKPTAEEPLPEALPQEAGISSTIHSIDLPLLYGYHFIKEGPYGLAVFGGPKLRYLLKKQSKVTFRSFDQQDIRERLYPFNVGLTLGVAVNISRIFFDFRYDIGLHNISRGITYDLPASDGTLEGEFKQDEINLHRHSNIMSFSMGVFF